MTLNEAEKILRSWQDFMEIADKSFRLQLPIPDSFLPYPKEAIEEGLNIMSKFYFNSGDKKMSKLIQDTMWGYLIRCKKDEEALEGIKNHLNLMFENHELKEILIEKLHESTDTFRKNKTR